VSKKDFTESMLYKQVANQNMTAVGIAMRYLKDRGYSDSVEVSGRQGEPIKIVEIKTYEKEEE
jgi:predicted transcriptional regulator